MTPKGSGLTLSVAYTLDIHVCHEEPLFLYDGMEIEEAILGCLINNFESKPQALDDQLWHTIMVNNQVD